MSAAEDAGQGLWASFGTSSLLLTASVVVNGETFTMARAVNPTTWELLGADAREEAKNGVRLRLGELLMKRLAPEVLVESRTF